MKQQTALVTGSSRGLGKDMALALAKKGIDVIITYKGNKEDAAQVAKDAEALGVKAAVLQLDMENLSSYDAFIQQALATVKAWGRDGIDHLVNNAGIGGGRTIADATEEFFDTMLNVHFKGVYFFTQKWMQHINDGGSVINISTGTTRFRNPGYSIYSSMKSAVETFTKHVAAEYGSRQIRANIVAPGPIETDFNGAAIRNNPQLKAMLGERTPLGRVGVAEDIGGVVAFLCTEDARWINGQRIEVAGGINM